MKRKYSKPEGWQPHNKGKGAWLVWLKERVGHTGDECLIFPGSRNHQGYGQLGYFGKVRKAHRVMCILVYGEPPSDIHEAAHNCGNGHLGCVHPKHLEWKTPSENRMDTIRHGTNPKKVVRRLTIDQVDVIRTSALSCLALAGQYGVSIAAIFKIKRGETWVRPRSTLTREQILRIRGSVGPAMAVAQELGISDAQVYRIRSGETHQGVE